MYNCPKSVLRVSALGGRTFEGYPAAAEFVDELAQNSVPIAGVQRPV